MSDEKPQRGYVITVYLFDPTGAETDEVFKRVADAVYEKDLANGDYFVSGRRMTEEEVGGDAPK